MFRAGLLRKYITTYGPQNIKLILCLNRKML